MARPPSTQTSRVLAELDGEIVGSVKNGVLTWKPAGHPPLATGITPVVKGHGTAEGRDGTFRTAVIDGRRFVKRGDRQVLLVYEIGGKAIVEASDRKTGPVGPPRVVELAEARELWRNVQ